MLRTISKAVFYGMSLIILTWSSSLTYSFVRQVLPDAHWLVPLFSLVLYDVGALGWLAVFVNYAEGTGQRAVSLIMMIINFIGIAITAMAAIYLSGQTIAAIPAGIGDLALLALGIWTIANVGAILAYHALSPHARKAMAFQAEKDAVIAESLERLKTKRAAVSGQLSDRMADGMLAELVAELATSNKPSTKTATSKPRESVLFSMNADGSPIPEVVSRDSGK